MLAFFDRCRGLIQNRGWRGFLKFVFYSFVRKSQDIVFELSLDNFTPQFMGNLDEQFTVELIDKYNINDQNLSWLINQVLAGENSIYKDGLNQKDYMVAICLNNKLVHTSFVQFETSYKKTLNEVNNTPLIGNCWTDQVCRGKKLYPYAITRCCKYFADKGGDRILISCDPGNLPSIAGIQKAGFKPIRQILTFLILTKFKCQKITENGTDELKFGML